MKILVDRLTTTPTDFRFEGSASWWRAVVPRQPEAAMEVLDPFAFEVAAHRMGEDLYLEGEVRGGLGYECSRCLARYRHALRESFRLILEPASGRSPADPDAARALAKDGMCLGDELEAGWFRGNEIELDAFFREVVSLALPVKPLCDEECAGLCPHCGADWNAETCDCREARSDSPFAALAALKIRSPGGRH